MCYTIFINLVPLGKQHSITSKPYNSAKTVKMLMINL